MTTRRPAKLSQYILPMIVLRRLDAVLEPTKQAVTAMKSKLDKARIANQDAALRQAAGQDFYNTSKFTLRDLRARASQQQLKADFEAYLDGFSPNVQDILAEPRAAEDIARTPRNLHRRRLSRRQSGDVPIFATVNV